MSAAALLQTPQKKSLPRELSLIRGIHSPHPPKSRKNPPALPSLSQALAAAPNATTSTSRASCSSGASMALCQTEASRARGRLAIGARDAGNETGNKPYKPSGSYALVFPGPAKTGSFLSWLVEKGKSAKGLLFQGPGRPRYGFLCSGIQPTPVHFLHPVNNEGVNPITHPTGGFP